MRGSIDLVFVWAVENELFLCAVRKGPGPSGSIETDLVFVWVVEIHLILLWDIGIYLGFVSGHRH